MKQFVLFSLFALALALSSCGMRKDCDCPSFTVVEEPSAVQG